MLPDCALEEVSCVEDEGSVRIQIPDLLDFGKDPGNSAKAAILFVIIWNIISHRLIYIISCNKSIFHTQSSLPYLVTRGTFESSNLVVFKIIKNQSSFLFIFIITGQLHKVSIELYKPKSIGKCSWDSNAGPQDGRRRWIHYSGPLLGLPIGYLHHIINFYSYS